MLGSSQEIVDLSSGYEGNSVEFEEGEEILWYDYDLADAKDLAKAVSKIKGQVTKTFEYDVWAKRTKYGVDSCPICDEYYTYVKADTHHFPPTISDVIEQTIVELIMKGTIGETTGIDMIGKVMGKHITGQVDYVVMCNHCHDKYHGTRNCPADPKVYDKTKLVFEQQVRDEYKKNKILQ